MCFTFISHQWYDMPGLPFLDRGYTWDTLYKKRAFYLLTLGAFSLLQLEPAGFGTSVELKNSKYALCFRTDSTFILRSRAARWPGVCTHSAGKYKPFSSDTIPSLALSWPVLERACRLNRSLGAVLPALSCVVFKDSLFHVLRGTLPSTFYGIGPGWGTVVCQIVIAYLELIWGPFVLSLRVSFPGS